MLEPFLDLLANAVDTTAALLALVALWEGRAGRGRDAILRWLGARRADQRTGVEEFVRVAQRRRARPSADRPPPSAAPPGGFEEPPVADAPPRTSSI